MSVSTQRTRPVVVGIDGSEGALAATRWAAAYAARIHAPLRLIHVVPDGDWYGPATFVEGGAFEDELRRLGRQELDTASTAAGVVAPDVIVETVLADGTLADMMGKIRAELLVLGSTRTYAARDILLGSNTIGIVNHAQSPVLIFRPGKEVRSPERPIVVGIDGSEESDRAFTVALELAHVLGATLVAANYWGIAANVGIGLGAGYVDWQKVRADQKQWLTAHVELMHDKHPDVPLSTVSEDGVASRGLRALSSTALMVAVGSRGRGALRGTALGSVSQNLVHHAECSVLIVR